MSLLILRGLQHLTPNEDHRLSDKAIEHYMHSCAKLFLAVPLLQHHTAWIHRSIENFQAHYFYERLKALHHKHPRRVFYKDRALKASSS